MLGTNRSSTSPDLVVALLRVDDDLGCCEQAFRRVRKDPAVRQAIARQIIKPVVRRFQVLVDYDDPRHRQLATDEHHEVHPALTAEVFPFPRTGLRNVTLEEIFLGRSLRIHQMLQFLEAIGRRPPCLPEARTLLNGILRDAGHPVMALCGEPFEIANAMLAVPSLLQIEARRMLTVCSLQSRWSQDYRFLAVAETS